MGSQLPLNYVKLATIGLGVLALGLALTHVPLESVSWGFLLLLAFSVLVTPRTSLTLPHSNLTFSFSESVIFLSFIVYGGELAILIAFFESVATCSYLKNRGKIKGPWIVLFNSSAASIVTAVSYAVLLAYEQFVVVGRPDLTNAHKLAAVLGILSLSQFLGSSIFAVFYYWVRMGGDVWDHWKNNALSSSLTQFTGACIAGIAYQLIYSRDYVLTAIVAAGGALIYLSYRQTIGQINTEVSKSEAAERERAETERARRREAEKHANELAALLAKEEKANEALRKSEKDLQHTALHDSLTNLPNRKHFNDRLRRSIEQYQDDARKTFFVLFLDLRKFKNINDSLGHALGDKVLQIAAKRFVRMLNADDMVARIGGDEFAVLLKGVSEVGKAQKIARRIYDNIAQPFSLSGNSLSVSVNIGIAASDAEYHSPEEILRDADIAMHYAKEWQSGVAVFTRELRERFLERIRYETDLRHAVQRNELTMHYQPLIDIQDGTLMGFEALLRWHHSEYGNIPPNKFIPIAEESGLIVPITVWILEQTTTQLAAWQRLDPSYRDLIVSVNISGKHLSNDDLIADVKRALSISKIDPRSLKLEITESTAMENAEHTIDMLNRLKLLGVQLSIDDFGTGYSSLSYLHRLPFDTLKIDRSFVYSVGEDGENSEILQTIISLAKNLKKKVVAEGIETEPQLKLLQRLGCDYGQGYLLARPQTVENTETLLYARKTWLPEPEPVSEEETIEVQVKKEEEIPTF